MLFMIPVAVDEVVAMGQFLRASKRKGKSLWRTFWVGGTLDEVNEDKRTPKYGAPASRMIGPMLWGVTAPWNLVLSAALGIWLMFAPAFLGTQGGAADSDHLVGALITTVAVIAMAEVIRAGTFPERLARRVDHRRSVAPLGCFGEYTMERSAHGRAGDRTQPSTWIGAGTIRRLGPDDSVAGK